MMFRLLAISGFLAAGHAVLFGLYWLMLGVPESNVFMLVTSATIVLLTVALAAWVEGVGLLAWQTGARLRDLARRGLGAIRAVVAGAFAFWLVWWVCGRAASWWLLHKGETDAWLMLHFNWTRTAALHSAVGWVVAFVRYPVGISLALTLVVWVAGKGFKALAGVRWLPAALSPRRLLLVTALLFLFFWLPTRPLDWRPAWLAPNWQETTFVAVKLGVLYAIANVGWALILRTGATKPE